MSLAFVLAIAILLIGMVAPGDLTDARNAGARRTDDGSDNGPDGPAGRVLLARSPC